LLNCFPSEEKTRVEILWRKELVGDNLDGLERIGTGIREGGLGEVEGMLGVVNSCIEILIGSSFV